MRTESESALAGFLAAWEKRAFRIAVIATGHQDEALDIVQDAMMKLVKRYRGRQEAEWAPLFQRILQSTIRDWYRRQRVRNRWRQFFNRAQTEEENEDSINQFAGDEMNEPDVQVQNEKAIQQLEAVLHALPLRQQQVFLLRQWEGMNVEDTARAMGISPGSVKTHYFRALQTLRSKLEDHWL